MPRVRGFLNKLIDDLVHQGKPPSDLGTIVVDEILHACVEGEFKPDKFVKYTVAPLVKKRRRK